MFIVVCPLEYQLKEHLQVTNNPKTMWDTIEQNHLGLINQVELLEEIGCVNLRLKVFAPFQCPRMCHYRHCRHCRQFYCHQLYPQVLIDTPRATNGQIGPIKAQRFVFIFFVSLSSLLGVTSNRCLVLKAVPILPWHVFIWPYVAWAVLTELSN